jgi:hypothetical protein
MNAPKGFKVKFKKNTEASQPQIKPNIKRLKIDISEKEKREPKCHKLLPTETILPDDYPIHWDYVYIIDNKFKRSEHETNVENYKRITSSKEIRRAEIFSNRIDVCIGDIVEK